MGRWYRIVESLGCQAEEFNFPDMEKLGVKIKLPAEQNPLWVAEREWVLVDIPSLPLNSKILSSKGKLSEESGKLVSFTQPSNTNLFNLWYKFVSSFWNQPESSQGTWKPLHNLKQSLLLTLEAHLGLSVTLNSEHILVWKFPITQEAFYLPRVWMFCSQFSWWKEVWTVIL